MTQQEFNTRYDEINAIIKEGVDKLNQLKLDAGTSFHALRVKKRFYEMSPETQTNFINALKQKMEELQP